MDAMGAQMHIVVDPMHGCWSSKARRYLHAIFPQCLISAINESPDSNSKPSGGASSRCRLDDLCDAVYRERAHLGGRPHQGAASVRWCSEIDRTARTRVHELLGIGGQPGCTA